MRLDNEPPNCWIDCVGAPLWIETMGIRID